MSKGAGADMMTVWKVSKDVTSLEIYKNMFEHTTFGLHVLFVQVHTH